jgi:hypothetical protein
MVKKMVRAVDWKKFEFITSVVKDGKLFDRYYNNETKTTEDYERISKDIMIYEVRSEYDKTWGMFPLEYVKVGHILNSISAGICVATKDAFLYPYTDNEKNTTSRYHINTITLKVMKEAQKILKQNYKEEKKKGGNKW